MRLVQATAFLATIGTAAVLAPAASAAPTLDPAAGFAPPSGAPGYITAGPDGNVWFSVGGDKEFGRITPDGVITEYDLPGNQTPQAIAPAPSAAGGPSDRVWVTYDGGVFIWDPVAETGTDHAIATLGPQEDGLVVAPDGNVWALERNGDFVIIAPDGNKVADVDTDADSGAGAALGSDGRIWWSDTVGKAIRATVPVGPTYATTAYPVSGGVGPKGIVAGPAGQLGFASPGNDVGRISTDGSAQQYTEPGIDAFGVSYAADGAYWYPLFATNQVGRLTTDGQFSKPIDLPSGAGPRRIAAGPNNTVWVAGEQDGKIYRITGVDPAPPSGGNGDGNGNGDGASGGGNPADSTAPALTGAKVNARKRKLSIRLSEAATVRVVVQQKRTRRSGKRYWKSVRRFPAAQRNGGRNAISLGTKRFTRGTYRVKLTASDAAGNVARRTVGFRVR